MPSVHVFLRTIVRVSAVCSQPRSRFPAKLSITSYPLVGRAMSDAGSDGQRTVRQSVEQLIIRAYLNLITASPLQPQQSVEQSQSIVGPNPVGTSPPQPQQSVEQSISISTLPNPSGSTEQSSINEPSVIQNLTVKFSCRRDKIERNFLLPEVDVDDIQTVKDLKFYLVHNLPIREIGSVGYLVKGRKKVWFHTDSELQKLIAGTLIKGKDVLWCDGTMQSAEKDDSMNSDEENADASPPTKKQRKPSASDERRERVQALFEDLKTKHGPSYSGP